MRGQIGLIVAKATLHRDIGNPEKFLADIGEAKEYAYNIHEDGIVETLEKIPSAEIADMLTSIGEEYGFDDETVAEIADLPYAQAFVIAYSYVIQAGLDADEMLSVFLNGISD